MRITEIALKNFRCFGDATETIELDDITALIGANGSGKTAVLVALTRLFGVSQSERHLRVEDFHVPHDVNPDDLEKIELVVEVRIEFPELKGENTDDSGVPQCFNQMVVESEGAEPFCRIRLDGIWTKGNLPEGDIEERVYWITTSDDDVTDEHKKPMQAYERSMIHVLYVPAFRDAAKQLSQASDSLVYRLLRAIEWSDTVKTAVADSAKAIRDSVHQEDCIRHLHDCLSTAWRQLQDFPAFSNVSFQPVSTALDDLLRRVEAVFSPGEDAREHSLDRLSEGLKSLFYFALVASVFQIEQAIKLQQQTVPSETEDSLEQDEQGQEPNPLKAFNADRLQPPALTIFAIEEPENHLAPHYVARIVELLKSVVRAGSGQVLLTSHSPAIMSRIDPEQVRYLRLLPESLQARVRKISLPSAPDEAFKYVKEAVRAYPELYFARFVILGEGDSEEVVIPRVAAGHKIPIDTNLVSVVPLGGRHVNHFWKLLRGLDIPHLTLLDFDRERLGGGWGRIHYACHQLITAGVPREKLLSVSASNGGSKILSQKEFDEMPKWTGYDDNTINGWLNMLEQHGVYFSSPLDLDFLMLRSFTADYHKAGDGSPQIPKEPDKYAERVSRATTAVLKDGGTDGSTYSEAEKADFIWYSYLFLGKGKPVTHILALNRIKLADLLKNTPPVLGRLCKALRTQLGKRDDSAH